MGEDEAKVGAEEVKQPVGGVRQEPIAAVPQPTPEQQLGQAFNTSLNLIVRELNILYGNVQAIINAKK